ncbi:10 kDa heat shock protein, mitochondrial [Sylvia borin]
MSHSCSGARQFQNLLERSCSPRVRGEVTSLPYGTRLGSPQALCGGSAVPPGRSRSRDRDEVAAVEKNNPAALTAPRAGGGGGVWPAPGRGAGRACARRDLPHVCAGGGAVTRCGRRGSIMAGKAFRKFLPLFDRVLVERCAAETVTKGGIMIPEKSQGKVLQATVVAVGSGARGKNGEIQPVSVKVGEKVLLPEYGGTKIVLEDKDYYLFRDGDILGKYVD